MVKFEVRQYVCPWPGCGASFERAIGWSNSHSPKGGHAVVSMVKCPRCGNFLKVKSGLLVRELKNK